MYLNITLTILLLILFIFDTAFSANNDTNCTVAEHHEFRRFVSENEELTVAYTALTQDVEHYRSKSDFLHSAVVGLTAFGLVAIVFSVFAFFFSCRRSLFNVVQASGNGNNQCRRNNIFRSMFSSDVSDNQCGPFSTNLMSIKDGRFNTSLNVPRALPYFQQQRRSLFPPSAASSPMYISIHVPTPEIVVNCHHEKSGTANTASTFNTSSPPNSFAPFYASRKNTASAIRTLAALAEPPIPGLMVFRRANSCVPVACSRTVSMAVDSEFDTDRNAFSLPSTPVTNRATPPNSSITLSDSRSKLLPKNIKLTH